MIETMSLQYMQAPQGPRPDESTVLAAELADLPEPVRRYFEFMRVVGRARTWSFRGTWRGRFRLGPSEGWHDCRASQYNRRDPVTRIFELHLHPRWLVSVVAHDVYAAGHGGLDVKLYDWLRIQEAHGPELDAGELVTYLNDAVLLAPSMLLHGAATFKALDPRSFEVRLRDEGRTVSGFVEIDERGAPLCFTTTDRYYRDAGHEEHPWKRTRWSTPVEGWEIRDGPPRLTGASAVWHLADEDFAYAQLWPNHDELTLNVAR